MTLQDDFNVCQWLHVRNNLLIMHSKHLVMVMPMLALIIAVVKWFFVLLELSGSWLWCMYSILTKCEDVILLLLFPSFAFLFILVPYIFWVLSFSHSPEFFAFMASSLHSLAGPWKFLLVFIKNVPAPSFFVLKKSFPRHMNSVKISPYTSFTSHHKKGCVIFFSKKAPCSFIFA